MISVAKDYFEFERAIGRDLADLFSGCKGLDWPKVRVLDVGCGYGGVLQGLSDRIPGIHGFGIDLDPEMIAEGQSKVDTSIHLECGDFLSVPTGSFDLVCLRDVLEHIGDYRLALEKAIQQLVSGGWLYLTFAPFEGPFGGHQQNGSGPAAWTPWLHYLPSGLFLSLIQLRGNSYKRKDQLELDMRSVLDTRLTESRFLDCLRSLPLQAARTRRYLSRPEYRHKFGIPSLRIPNGLPLGSALSTGIEVLAQKK